MIKQCIIVIPIYKQKPLMSEYASLKQCLSILHNYDISIVTHNNLDLSAYWDLLESHQNIFIKYFDEAYFTSVISYNKLCLNKDFYLSFNNYKYMLIYQLDAWVFKDELMYWCSKDYDYIGAPFFKNKRINKKDNFTKEIIGIGNGGFSLRKIDYCIRLLSETTRFPLLKPSFLWKMNISYIENKKLFPYLTLFFKVLIKSFGYRNSSKYIVDSALLNEDYYFSLYTANSWTKIDNKLPTEKEASLFAFEVNPSYLYSINKTLPFGCHAFEKWEYDNFWKKYISF